MNTNLENVRIELFDGNASQLKTIFESAFLKPYPLEHYQYKLSVYSQAPSCLGFVAFNEKNNPIAFYGVYTCEVIFEGKKYIIGQVADTMTHADYMGKGLFTTLGIKAQEYCKQHHIQALFAFPNEKSFPGFIGKLGWQQTDEIISVVVRVYTIPWLRIKSILKSSSFLHESWCRFVTRFYTKSDHIEPKLEDEQLFVCHDTNYKTYKKYTKNYILRISGIHVWVKFDDEFLLIGDMDLPDEDLFKVILAKLKRLAFLCGVPHIRFQGSSGTRIGELFKKHGRILESRYPIIMKDLSNELPIKRIKFVLADNDTF